MMFINGPCKSTLGNRVSDWRMKPKKQLAITVTVTWKRIQTPFHQYRYYSWAVLPWTLWHPSNTWASLHETVLRKKFTDIPLISLVSMGCQQNCTVLFNATKDIIMTRPVEQTPPLLFYRDQLICIEDHGVHVHEFDIIKSSTCKHVC